MSSKWYVLYLTGVESIYEVQIEERLVVEALVAVIMNFERYGIKEYGYLVAALERNEYR